VRESGAGLRADVVLVPHHGSRTSSSPAFVNAVAPSIALIGAGHRNRFDLPRAEVVARYVDLGAEVYNSADRGAVRLRLGSGGVRSRTFWRQHQARLWHDAKPD
jgi:competence protein ComEC